MRHGFVLAILLLSLLSFVPSTNSQALQSLYSFEMTVDPGTHIATLGTGGRAHITFVDKSRDSPQGLASGASGGVLAHIVSFRVTPGLEENKGWLPSSLGSIASYPGETHTKDLIVQVFPQATNPYYLAHINATVQTTQDVFYLHADVLFFTKGIAGFSVLPGPAIDNLRPVQIQQASISIYNIAPLKRTFEMEVGDNPCNLAIGPPATTVIAGHSFQQIQFSIAGPNSRFNPLGDDLCVVGLKIHSQDNPGQVLAITVPVKVTGTYFDPMTVFYVVAVICLIILVILFLRRRKERLEEEILGKPQKPWLIPVEQVYLRHLKKKDPRAWYVVRNYLMEDEYRSSLAWYKAYKKATKGDRQKERLVLVQEKQYARWKRGWEKDIAAPMVKADKFEAKLQRKLDRKARKKDRKALAKWRGEVKKIEARHEKALDKESALHAKLLARARKKGLPEPEPPAMRAPELPPEPTPQAIPLSGHRWQKKADRIQRRMAKKQGNLEVQFEKADARKQAKLKRKVAKLSRDLHDAEFVAHHGGVQE
ncbi:MAG TPA: hypothetical protein VM286_09880 [Candidatus Thermoplasmatota archaeon]|nr:hypothetical protein [Candidatus Thermoplasmatota archaeon]